MPKHSRRYNAVAERIPEDSVYQPREAIDLVKELSTAKFDETMEVHLRTNADVRHAEDGPQRQLLHCSRLVFPDPDDPGGPPACVTAPLPSDFPAVEPVPPNPAGI